MKKEMKCSLLFGGKNESDNESV